MTATTGNAPSHGVADALRVMAKAGLMKTAQRVARGYAMKLPDLLYNLTAEEFKPNPDLAKTQTEWNAAIDRWRAIRNERRRFYLGVFLAVGGWVTGGWLAIGRTEATYINLILVAAGAVAGLAAHQSAKVVWQQAAPWVVAPIVSLAALWVHTQKDVPVWQMALPVVAVDFLWTVYAAGPDGTTRDNLTGGTKADEIRSEPYHRIVWALGQALGLKPDDTQAFTVIGGGLRQIDDIWSEIVIQTPGTITTAQVTAVSAKLAATMGLSTSRISICEDGAEGVVRISIASKDQWAESKPWPLIHADRWSVWDMTPFATDERGGFVHVALLFSGWLIAAVPRVGKTLALRMLILAWALDPTTDIAVFDFKAGRNLTMLRRLCVAWGHGADDDTIKAFRDFLLRVIDDAKTKKTAFNKLPTSVVPHGQLTREAVAASPVLRPLLIAADEVHWATTHEEYGTEIIDLLSKIGKDLPFLGVVEALASQRLDAKETMPTKLRNVLASRLALKLFSTSDSRMILGDAANGLGFNAGSLPQVKGLGIIHGTDDSSSIDGYLKVKTCLHDDVQAEAIAQRAYELRLNAGVIPAARTDPAPELVAVAEILRASGEESMLSEEVARRLGTTPQRLRDKTGVRSRQNPGDSYRRHLYLEDVEDALERPGVTEPLRVVGKAAGRPLTGRSRAVGQQPLWPAPAAQASDHNGPPAT